MIGIGRRELKLWRSKVMISTKFPKCQLIGRHFHRDFRINRKRQHLAYLPGEIHRNVISGDYGFDQVSIIKFVNHLQRLGITSTIDSQILTGGRKIHRAPRGHSQRNVEPIRGFNITARPVTAVRRN